MTARPAPTVHDGSGVRGVAPGRHRIAPTRSTLAFRVREFGMVTVTGTFAVLDGEAVVTDGVARVRVVADAGSFTTGNRRRDADVRGHRFLDAATFPELTWTGELADGTTTAPGTLRVRDVETPCCRGRRRRVGPRRDRGPGPDGRRPVCGGGARRPADRGPDPRRRRGPDAAARCLTTRERGRARRIAPAGPCRGQY
ncbi:YceI family protein [Pseudonocardia benzenivorans]